MATHQKHATDAGGAYRRDGGAESEAVLLLSKQGARQAISPLMTGSPSCLVRFR